MFDTTKKPATKRPRKMAREPKAVAAQTTTTSVVEDKGATVALDATSCPTTATAKAPTKTSLVLELLSRHEGATIDEMVAVTGWLPHTTRAALTGLKKKGHTIERRKADDCTSYHRV